MKTVIGYDIAVARARPLSRSVERVKTKMRNVEHLGVCARARRIPYTKHESQRNRKNPSDGRVACATRTETRGDQRRFFFCRKVLVEIRVSDRRRIEIVFEFAWPTTRDSYAHRADEADIQTPHTGSVHPACHDRIIYSACLCVLNVLINTTRGKKKTENNTARRADFRVASGEVFTRVDSLSVSPIPRSR